MLGTSKGTVLSTRYRDLSYLCDQLYSDGCTIFTYSFHHGRRTLDYGEIELRFASDRQFGVKTRVRVRAPKGV